MTLTRFLKIDLKPDIKNPLLFHIFSSFAENVLRLSSPLIISLLLALCPVVKLFTLHSSQHSLRTCVRNATFSPKLEPGYDRRVTYFLEFGSCFSVDLFFATGTVKWVNRSCSNPLPLRGVFCVLTV